MLCGGVKCTLWGLLAKAFSVTFWYLLGGLVLSTVGRAGCVPRGAPVKAGLKAGAAAKHSERETGVTASHTQTRFPIFSVLFPFFF